MLKISCGCFFFLSFFLSLAHTYSLFLSLLFCSFVVVSVIFVVVVVAVIGGSQSDILLEIYTYMYIVYHLSLTLFLL